MKRILYLILFCLPAIAASWDGIWRNHQALQEVPPPTTPAPPAAALTAPALDRTAPTARQCLIIVVGLVLLLSATRSVLAYIAVRGAAWGAQ